MAVISSSSITPQIRWNSYGIIYTLTGSPSDGQITNIQWTYQFTSPCATGWSTPFDTGTNTSAQANEGNIGTFTMKALVTVRRGYTNPVVIPVTTSFTVLPPDDIVLPDPTTGANTATNYMGTMSAFAFGVKCAGEVIKPSGTVKEDLAYCQYMGAPSKEYYGVGDPRLLFVQGMSIIDMKGAGVPPGQIGPRPTGYIFYRCQQQLYLSVPDGCGQEKLLPVGKPFFVVYTKAPSGRGDKYTATITPP